MLSAAIRSLSTRCPQSTTVLVWTFGLIILSAITIKEFYPLLYQYRNNNAVTLTNVVGQNATVTPPPVAVCIPWTTSKLQELSLHLGKIAKNQTTTCESCDKLFNAMLDQSLIPDSCDFWRPLDFKKTDSFDYIRQNITKEILWSLLDTDFEILTLNNSAWNQPIVDTVWDLFACIGELDEKLNSDKKVRSPCAIKLIDYALSNKSKIDNLFRRLIDIFCEYITFQYPFPNGRIPYKSTCLQTFNKTASVLSKDQLCFALPTLSASFPNLIVTSFSEIHGVWSAFDDAIDPFRVFSDPEIIALPIVAALSNSFPILTADRHHDYLSLTYAVDLTVVDRRDGFYCYRDSSPAVCKSNCLIRTIIQKCQCIPFTFRNHVQISNTMDYCNSSIYLKCNLNKTKQLNICEVEECMNPCRYTSYKWYVNGQPNNEQQWKRFTFSLYPINVIYIEFFKTVKNSQSQFFSQVGSIFNLYLGVSGISVIASILFCGRLLKRWCINKRRKKPDTKVGIDLENQKTDLEVKIETLMVRCAELEASVHYLKTGHGDGSKFKNDSPVSSNEMEESESLPEDQRL